MTIPNTIAHKEPAASLPFVGLFAFDNPTVLDEFGAPTTERISASQLSDYIYRSMGVPTFVGEVNFGTLAALDATYNNGASGVGATLTMNDNGALITDGKTPVDGNLIAVLSEASDKLFRNGLYTIVQGTASTPAVLTRATNYDETSQILFNSFIRIIDGDTLAGKAFAMVTAANITVGTTDIIWRLPSSALISAFNAFYLSGTGNFIATISNATFPTFFPGAYSVAFTGANTTGTNPPAGIIGNTTQASLSAGTPVSLTSGTAVDIVSITLPKRGQYRIDLNPQLVFNTTTSTDNLVFVGTAAGNSTTGITAFNSSHIGHMTAGASGTSSMPFSFEYICPADNTVLYLKAQATFSLGTVTAYGALSATLSAAYPS